MKHVCFMTLSWLSVAAQAEPIRLDIAAGKVGEASSITGAWQVIRAATK